MVRSFHPVWTVALAVSVVATGCLAAEKPTQAPTAAPPAAVHTTRPAPEDGPLPAPEREPTPTGLILTGASTSAPVTPGVRRTLAPIFDPGASTLPSVLVANGPRTSRFVALTFDAEDWDRDEVALGIMDWLLLRKVPATIFMLGSWLEHSSDAGRETMSIIDANPALFTLGNHSQTHPHFSSLTAAQVRDELWRSEALMGRFCAKSPRPYFRPPFGDYNADVLAAVGAAGYGLTVRWDVDPTDWSPPTSNPPGPTATEIAARVLAKAKGGSIVDLHLEGDQTLQALPLMVAGLQAAGFELVNLDRMLAP